MNQEPIDQEESDGTTTARGMMGTDLKLWARPKGGNRFLLAWGPESAMAAKLVAERERDIWLERADGTRI